MNAATPPAEVIDHPTSVSNAVLDIVGSGGLGLSHPYPRAVEATVDSLRRILDVGGTVHAMAFHYTADPRIGILFRRPMKLFVVDPHYRAETKVVVIETHFVARRMQTGILGVRWEVESGPHDHDVLQGRSLWTGWLGKGCIGLGDPVWAGTVRWSQGSDGKVGVTDVIHHLTPHVANSPPPQPR